MARRTLSAPSRSLRARPATVKQVGRSHVQKSEPRNVRCKLLPRGKRLGHHRPHRDDRRLSSQSFRSWPRLAKPISPRERRRLPAIVRPLDLADRPGRQPQIGRLAVGRIDQAERFFHHRRQLVGKGGLVMAQPGLAECDQRGIDRLVRAALGAKRDPARGRDQQEARILVTGVVERIEPARDERVVERPNRNQPLAEHVSRKPGCGEHQEQIILGNPQFDVLAGRRHRPFLRARDLRLGEHVGHCLAAKQAALVHEPTQIGRDGDVGRGGQNPVGKRSARLGEVEQDPPERRLGRLLVPDRRRNRGDREPPEIARSFVPANSAL